jgi:hypothetical protein
MVRQTLLFANTLLAHSVHSTVSIDITVDDTAMAQTHTQSVVII